MIYFVLLYGACVCPRACLCRLFKHVCVIRLRFIVFMFFCLMRLCVMCFESVFAVYCVIMYGMLFVLLCVCVLCA